MPVKEAAASSDEYEKSVDNMKKEAERRAEQEKSGLPPVETVAAQEDSKDKKGVLIIDDEKSNIIALTHFLRDEYSVYVTRDSRDAAEMAEEHMPDVILLDIIMPDKDGYEVIAELKKGEKTKHIPVVFISGLTSPEAMVKGLSMGAVDYIPKPFESSVVKSKIKRLVSR